MTFSKLGTDSDTGQIVELPQSSRREGLYIIGATGTGKSTLLENLILQDINQGLGVCVLDPHGDLVNAVLSRMKKRLEDVILVDLGSRDYVAGLNLFHCENPKDPFEAENVVQAVMHILAKVYNISRDTPLMNQYFINITRTLIYNQQATVLDIPRLLTNEAFRHSLLTNVPDAADNIHWFWTELYEQQRKGRRLEEILTAVTDKLDEFNSDVLKPWFGQTTQTLPLRQIMEDRKILLVKLKARWQSMTSLIGSIFIAQILDAAYSRADTPVQKRKQFNLYADEFQTFASQDFAQLFTEARKYGIGITISHQVFEQLDLTIKATIKQAANIVVFRVSSDNAKEIAGEFDCTPPPGEPVREQVMRPVYTTVPELEWDSEENRLWYEKQQQLREKQAYQAEVTKAAFRLLVEICVWDKTIDLSSYYPTVIFEKLDNGDFKQCVQWRWLWLFSNDARQEGRLTQQALLEEEKEAPKKYKYNPPAALKQLLERIELERFLSKPNYIASLMFNLAFRDERVKEYLATYVYMPGAAIDSITRYHDTSDSFYDKNGNYRRDWKIKQAPLRNPRQMHYTFPADLPCVFEQMLERIITWEQGYPHYWLPNGWNYSIDTTKEAAKLLLQAVQSYINSRKPHMVYTYYPYMPHIEAGVHPCSFLEYGGEWKLHVNHSSSIHSNHFSSNIYREEIFWKTVVLPDAHQFIIHLYDTLKQKVLEDEEHNKELAAFYAEHNKTVQKVVYAGHDEPVYTEVMYNGRVERTPQYRWKPGNPPYGSDEVERRIANQIKSLQKFTARVRIASGEYTIATEKPSGYCAERDLQIRIADIQQQNLDKKYLRKRDDVEAELAQRRQSFLRGQAYTHQHSRHARQVPLQEK